MLAGHGTDQRSASSARLGGTRGIPVDVQEIGQKYAAYTENIVHEAEFIV